MVSLQRVCLRDKARESLPCTSGFVLNPVFLCLVITKNIEILMYVPQFLTVNDVFYAFSIAKRNTIINRHVFNRLFDSSRYPP